MQIRPFADVISAFGADAKAKLDNPAITGAPEDQLRSPLEGLIKGLAALRQAPASAACCATGFCK